MRKKKENENTFKVNEVKKVYEKTKSNNDNQKKNNNNNVTKSDNKVKKEIKLVDAIREKLKELTEISNVKRSRKSEILDAQTLRNKLNINVEEMLKKEEEKKNVIKDEIEEDEDERSV